MAWPTSRIRGGVAVAWRLVIVAVMSSAVVSTPAAGLHGQAPPAAGAAPGDAAPGDAAPDDAASAAASPLLVVAGGEHRWFLGPVAEVAGVGIGHQGPEMPADAFRTLAILGGTPRLLAAFDTEAWIVTDPPVPGGPYGLFAVRVARNPVHGIWYPAGAMAVRPVGRLPVGVQPRLAAATPAGPIILAEPDEPGGPWTVLRLAAGQWTRRPLAGDLGRETPIGLAVVRLPGRPRPVEDPPAESDLAEADLGEADLGEATPGVFTVTLLLLEGPDGPALDLLGRGGERQRIWRGGPARGGLVAAGPQDPPPGLLIVSGRPWLATTAGDRLIFDPIPVELDPRATDASATATSDEPATVSRRFEVARPAGPVAVAGGDGLLLIEGSMLIDPDTPPSVRSWTVGGGEDLAGPLEPIEVDPSVILRGPIILGTGIFVAVMAAVLGSRPGPRPEAIAGREAPVGRRLLAAAIDAVPPLAAAALVFGWTPSVLLASLMLLHPAGLVPWAGFTLLWSFASVVGDLSGGRTPGRLLMGLRLVDGEGRPLRRSRALARFLLRTLAVAFPPLILFWLAHARGRAVHDLLTGSWVVRLGGSTPEPKGPGRSPLG